ncbi:MAG TPA: DUF308 domain-containing protein [Candidatus Corynebacterium avicola]|uniref:DUF308 domain-containing protein n=1 Tax=Candidatus Corynebacterium avicola TaxID=2838527 RepID=A0A9D1RPH7_9CORY|nr:DUF308 domain-containing protein [Candidatus Corynebacterium avicola]
MITRPGDVTGASYSVPGPHLGRHLRDSLGKMLLWRGALGVVAGLLLLFFPVDTAVVIGIMVGAWLVVDGLSMCGLGLNQRSHGASCAWTMFSGIVTALTGVAVLLFPVGFAVVGTLAVLWITAIGLVVTGVSRLISRSNGWSISTGVLNLIFGVLLAVLCLSDPSGSVVALAWTVGLYALLFGVLAVVSGILMRRNS